MFEEKIGNVTEVLGGEGPYRTEILVPFRRFSISKQTQHNRSAAFFQLIQYELGQPTGSGQNPEGFSIHELLMDPPFGILNEVYQFPDDRLLRVLIPENFESLTRVIAVPKEYFEHSFE